MSGVCGCMLFSSKQSIPVKWYFVTTYREKISRKQLNSKYDTNLKQLSQNKLPSIFQYFDYFGHIDIPINIQYKNTTDVRKDTRKGKMFHFLNI